MFRVKKPGYRVREFPWNDVILCGNPSRKNTEVMGHGGRVGRVGCGWGVGVCSSPGMRPSVEVWRTNTFGSTATLSRGMGCGCPSSLLPGLFALRATHPSPAVPLQGALTLSFSARALLLLAVKTETFYSVHKPEVTQLNETICHIKFTSAGIKRQIT